MRTLHDLEKLLQVRVVAGGPPYSGPEDPDGMGFVLWQPVIYCTHWADALTFIHFILQYKLQRGYLKSMPELRMHLAGANCTDGYQLQAPWFFLEDPASFKLPGPFDVLPPKGRRHVLAQLEKHPSEDAVNEAENLAGREKGTDGGTTYVLTFFGGIYHFKDGLEKEGLKSIMVGTADENPPGKKEFARYLLFRMGDEVAMQQIHAVLVDALKELPVYFINMTDKGDVAAEWLQRQPSIFHAEGP